MRRLKTGELTNILSVPRSLMKVASAHSELTNRVVEDPDLGYDAENFPYKQPQRGIRPTFRAGLLRG
jgi:hypothetical protein